MNEKSERLLDDAQRLLNHGQADAALERAQAAIRIDRMEARYHYAAAISLAALERVEEAIESLHRALRFRPSYLEARGNLGILLERAGRLEEAADCYRKVAAAQRDDVNAWNRLGHCARLLGRTAESLDALRQSLRLRADAAPTHNELALALLQDGQRAEAAASFRRAVALDPAFLPAWANLAKLLYLDFAGTPPEERGPLKAGVIEAFDKVLALEPGHEEFRFLRAAVAGVQLDRAPDAYVAAFFDRFAPHFDEHVAGKLRYDGPALAREMIDPWLAARAPVRVLDMGCGTGLSGKAVRAHAAHLAGVDLSAGMLERAQALGIYDELEQDEAVAYLERTAAGSLDLVLALDVFIYVGGLERIVPAIARVLGEGGRLVASVESLATGEYALVPSGRYAHSPRYLEGLASTAGLALVQSREFVVREEAGRPLGAVMLVFAKGAATSPRS